MESLKSPLIAAVIPTFNEQDVLRQAIQSLLDQGQSGLRIVVVNAGDPLEPDLAALVEEIPVSSNCFWTRCTQVGFEYVKKQGFDYVLMANADMTLFPGTIQKLLDVAKAPNTVAACPIYERRPDDSIRLIYSDAKFYPLLLHSRPKKDWDLPTEAPIEPFETPVIGGQGVLLRTELLNRFDVDPKHFPQAKGDHDFWLSMKKEGVRIMVAPKAGAVNLRGFGPMQRFSRKKKLKRLWSRATAKTSNDSAWVMWHMRRKHQPMPLALASFAVMYPWRLVKGVLDALKKPTGIVDENSTA